MAISGAGAYARPRIEGTASNDTIHGTASDEHIDGSAGNDTISGGGGNDQIYGGAGDDLLVSGGFDPVSKLPGADTVADMLDGGDGNDKLYGSSARDTMVGGAGNDELFGGLGDDALAGSAGDDELYGNDGHDSLFGGDGDDLLVGGDGSDWFDGGNGRNYLLGGQGNDKYDIRSVHDVVYDSGGLDRGTIMVDWYKTSPTVESWTWAPGVQKLPYWIDAITYAAAIDLAGEMAKSNVIEYSFAQAPAGFFDDKDKSGFTAFSAEQISYTREVLAYIEECIDVRFVETSNPNTPYSITFGNNTQDKSAAYARMMNNSGGTVVMLNKSNDPLMSPGGDDGVAFFSVMLHEIAHTLGLKHPFSDADAVGTVSESPYLPAAEDVTVLTVMSYTGGYQGYNGYSAYDLAALQYLYGIPDAYNPEDDLIEIEAGKASMILDGAGIDTLDGSHLGTALTLHLEPGYWSHVGAEAETFVAAGQLTINFDTVIENALGGSGADRITGNWVANTIDGGAGDDVLQGGGGSDTLNGGAGLDSAVFAGNRAGFTVTPVTGGWTVTDSTGAQGSDKLAGIERIVFDDGALALDLEGIAAQAYRLYAAAFNRKPDPGGLGYWMNAMDNGSGLIQVATGFIGTNEFTTMYGASRSSQSFLEKLYQNVLHRAPDEGGLEFWMNSMKAGLSEAEVLAQFSESTENRAQVIGQIEHGIAYLPFGGA